MEPKWLSEGTKSILRCMLQVNPKYRLSVDQLLNHTWCQEGKAETLPSVDPSPVSTLKYFQYTFIPFNLNNDLSILV